MKPASVLSLIVARTSNGVIGHKGELPWTLPSDLARFKRLTTGHPVVMGRTTWESLPEKYRPLPDRTNIVLTRQAGYAAPGAIVVDSLEAALAAAASAPGADEIFIIGGRQIYELFLPIVERVYITLVRVLATGDTVFPIMRPGSWSCVHQSEPRHYDPRDTAVTSLQILERVRRQA